MEEFDIGSATLPGTPGECYCKSSVRKIPPRSGRVSNTSNQILMSIPDELFEKIRGSLRPIFLKRDQFLCFEDDDVEYVYFPETAVISDFKTLEDGRTVEVALEGNVGAVGVLSIFGHSRAANCSQVAQAGSAIRIESQVLEKMARLHPELSSLLCPDVKHYVRQISQRAICNTYHSVRERFCTWLLTVQDLSGKKTLELTHAHIARALGVYRPSVTSTAVEMRHDGLIDYSRGGITIKDRTKIEESACACYAELRAVQ